MSVVLYGEFWADCGGGLGGLHLSNVVMEDARDGAPYVCAVENEELRAIVEGDDQKILPQPISGDSLSLYRTQTTTQWVTLSFAKTKV